METSKSELLSWIAEATKVPIQKVEHLGNGVAFCKLVSVMDPAAINLNKVNQRPKNQLECISNLKLLQSGLAKLHIKKILDIDKMSRQSFHENFEFLSFIRKQFTLRSIFINQENIDPQKSRNFQTQGQSATEASFMQSTNDTIGNIAEENLRKVIRGIILSEESTHEKLFKIAQAIGMDPPPIQEVLRESKVIFRTDSKRKQEVEQIHEMNNRLYQSEDQQKEFANVNSQSSTFLSAMNNENLVEQEGASSQKKLLELSQKQREEQIQQSLRKQTPQFSQEKIDSGIFQSPILMFPNQGNEDLFLSATRTPMQNQGLSEVFQQPSFQYSSKPFAFSVQKLALNNNSSGIKSLEEIYSEYQRPNNSRMIEE